MTDKQPKITTFTPIVLPDKRRITMNLVVSNLPTTFSNVALSFPEMDNPGASPQPKSNAPSPYPNIELAILDSAGREVTSLLIVEHQEEHTSLTLHFRGPPTDVTYTARATMTYQEETLQQVNVPFTLTPDEPAE